MTSMSKRSVADITKQWQTNLNKRRSRPSAKQILKRSPNSLEAKLAVSPYAAILASPLRRCAFSSRIFPSRLLLRFGLGWHPETKMNWAFPSLSKSKGFGYYVNLKKEVLQLMQRGAYQSVFRGSAAFRSDMTEHTQKLLFKQSLKEFERYPIEKYTLLSPLSASQWTSAHGLTSPLGYQCILLFDVQDSSLICQLDHKIDSHTHIPCYNMQQFWSKHDIEAIKSQLNHKTPFALGVPKTKETVQLAIDLWRCRQFITN